MGRKQVNGVKAASASSIEIDFYYNGRRCRERIKLKPTPTNLKRAERHRLSILEAIDAGTFDYSVTFPKSKRIPKSQESQYKIAKFLTAWLANIKKHIAVSTYTDYRKTVENVLIPTFGDIPIHDFKRLHIRNWGKNLTVSNKRISNILTPLRSCLNEAVEDEIIQSNPLAGWNYKHKEPPKKSDIDPFRPEEITAILNTIKGQGKNILQFAFWTGMRTSEYIALNWGDVDFTRGSVFVNKALTQFSDKPEATKTEAGTREIKLLTPAIEALKAQKQYTFIKSEEVFQNPRTLERWTGDQPIRKTLWTHALKKAGVRYRRPYQTRHTYASMMLSAGESPAWIKTQMGHTDLGLIFRTYGKWIPEANKEAGNLAVEMFKKANS